MTFLNPAWLWGLLALSIPVIVHLFNFRKTRRIYFSNTRFIKKVQEASRSRRKLKHYLVLLSRLLFIFWLVMAFAQPFIPASEGSLQNERVYFYLDNSFSMSRESGEQLTAFEESIEYIEELIALYPQGTDFYLLTNDFDPFSHAPHSATQLSELLTEVRLSGIIRNSEEIIGRWRSQQLVNGEGDYYFISDFQKSTIDLPSLDQSWNDFQLNAIPVKSEITGNIYIDSIYLDNPFLIGKQSIRLHVRLNNRAATEASEVAVRIFLDEAQVASTTVDISAEGSQTIAFDLMANSVSRNLGRITIEEYPITFDNELYFVLDLGRRIEIVEIRQGTGATPVSRVFGNQDLFSFQAYDYNNFDYNALSQTDLLILNGLQTINPSLRAALLDFMDKGGNVMLIPNREPDLTSYQALYPGITLTDTIYNVKIQTPDFNNPFFANVFEERNPAVDMPEVAPVITWSGLPSHLKLNNDMPFLSVSNDQLYLMASPLVDGYSTLHRNALFVPVMYKIAALSTNQEKPLYYSLDEKLLEFNVDSIKPNEIFTLVKNQEEIIPAQRFQNDRLILQLPAYLVNTGYYNLIRDGNTKETIAFNINKEESKLEVMTMEEIEQMKVLFPNLEIYDVNDKEEFRKTLEEQYVGFSLWKICLILSVIFLLTEILIIRFVP